MEKYFAIFSIIAILVTEIDCRVRVSFKLHQYENLSHNELDGGCCDHRCGSCDNRFNLCFDVKVYGGNNDMTRCAYGNYETDRLYRNNDNFNFPADLATRLSNPIVFTLNSGSTGFRSKIEVWDNDDSPNRDDKIDFYGYNYGFQPARTDALAPTHTVTLTGEGTSTTTVQVKVYCARHYYGTSSGCSTYCLARDDFAGHYDCNDFTGAKMCHPGWTGSNCQQDINECNSRPCQHGGTCTNLANDFRCNCPAGTAGKTCDNINECSSDPCENGGTCMDFINYYTCACTIRYTGIRCQFEVDHCASSPCLNGATCLGLDDNGVVECTCADGYTGVHCGTDIDECVGVDCANGGTCVDLVNRFECRCIEGYQGPYCEVDVRDECASSPCQNNASCVDEVDGYVCVCPPGFQSDQCEENVNECEPNPCVHGNCTDKINKYKCECFEGYTGVNCTEEIDDCVGNRCQHNSTCQDGFTTYTCDCVPGYTGQYCETDIDECALVSYPCLHGGVCDQSQAVNSFTCDCTSTGYMGARCEVDLDECAFKEPVCREYETCVNMNGSYLCETPPSTTPLPGLCRTSVCYNKGNCSIVDGEYRCICTGDYTGELCETPTVIDECASAPCQNNASCVDEVDGYVCVCPAGFQSDQCEENINECEPNPCVHGNCTDKINKYKCECFEGYTGVNCSEEIDDCVGSRCQHNSTCQDGFTTYTCDCVPGYTGQYCETDIDECALESYPCLHGGVCDQSQAVNSFTCDCTPTGYMGARCEIDLDECALTDPPVCREDETCVNMNGSYLCEPPVSTTPLPGLCRTSVCYNKGNCSIVDGEYRCICMGDYTGELCETPPALCTPNPCFNGGFCRVNMADNGSVSFQCRCEENYSGSTCQIPIPGRRIGSNTAGSFAFWYIIPIIIILIIVLVLVSFFFYRNRKRKAAYMDGEPTVYANPHAATIYIGPTLGATAAAPPLPPKGTLDKLGDPIDSSMTFENNLYCDIDELQIRGAHAPPVAPPPYSPNDRDENENPYAFGGYTPMGTAPLPNGHAVRSPQDDSQYEPSQELAQEQADNTDQGENKYSVDPTVNGSVRRPLSLENKYSTHIQRGPTRPDSIVVPPPLPRRHTLDLDHSPSSANGPAPLSIRNKVPEQPSSPDNPYDTNIFNDKDVESESL